MRRDEALAILTTHKDELARYHVKSLALFGSVACDEAGPDSDVDVLVEFDGPATADGYFGILSFLEDLLACPVDLVTRKGLRAEVAPYIEKDLLRVAGSLGQAQDPLDLE
jgi:predicted nucleotidyltransferase